VRFVGHDEALIELLNKSVRVRRWTGRFKQGGLIFSVFKNIVFIPTAFERGVDGVHVESAIGEEARLFLFVFQIGGGVFEFFLQQFFKKW